VLLADTVRPLQLQHMVFGTFISPSQARGKGHMHIADFIANAHRFQVRVVPDLYPSM
jgi:hypothetical protein